VARQRELEKVLNHDVIGFTTAVAEKIDEAPVAAVYDRRSSASKTQRRSQTDATEASASRWFHFGLTSSDVGDTCYAVQMMQSADILVADVKAVLPVIARREIGRAH